MPMGGTNRTRQRLQGNLTVACICLQCGQLVSLYSRVVFIAYPGLHVLSFQDVMSGVHAIGASLMSSA